MKNLLVEALRQADPSAEPPARDEEAAASTVAASPPEVDSEAAESGLELVDEGQPVDGFEEPSLSAAESVPADAETTTVEDAGLAVQAGATDIDAGSGTEDEGEPPLVVSPRRPDLLARAARLSPLLYALTVTAAAASLTGYQRLNPDDMNVTLSMLKAPPPASDSFAETKGGWQLLAEGRTVSVKRQMPEERHGGAKERGTEPLSNAAPADRWQARSVTVQHEDPALDDVRRAYDAYHDGDHAQAEARYRAALAKDPYHLHALLGLAAVYERTERGASAQALYRQVLSAHPTNADAASRLVATLTRGDERDAETRLKLLQQQYAETPSIHSALGNFLAERQRWPEAYEAFQTVVELQPSDSDAHYNLGVSAERIGKFDSARDHYAAALAAASPLSTFSRQDVESRLSALSQVRSGRP